MARSDSLKRLNNIEMLALSVLHEQDCYGYQISQRIKEYSNENISLPEGSLYPVLYRLVDNGYISDQKIQVGKRMTRVYYHIEQSGEEYLLHLLNEYRSLHSSIQNVIKKSLDEKFHI